jgi:voltage-gated potassium channel Kch
LEKIRIEDKNLDAVIIATGHTISDALELYKTGADYVILPHILGGEMAAQILKKTKLKELKKIRKREIAELLENFREGEKPNESIRHKNRE